MKVLEINSVCNGSTGNIAYSICKELELKGDKCIIAYGRGKQRKDVTSIKIGNKFSIVFHGIFSRIFDCSGFLSKLATKKLIKKIKQYDPDVIHLHNLHGYYINIKELFKYLKESNKKVVWTLHDCWPITGHCAHFMSVNCNKWETGCSKCKYKFFYPKSLFLNNSKKNYLKKKEIFTSLNSNNMIVVSPSLWLKNVVEKSFLSKYQIKVINNGININAFRHINSNIKERYHINKNKKIILGVAFVWTEKKGYNDFLKLSKNLSSEYQIVMIGLSKKQIKEIPNNILGIERTESQFELAEWYSVANVLFNPTKEDNYPTILLEAISCGTNILTSNVGGCAEIVKKSLNYAFIDENDLLNQIKQLSSKPYLNKWISNEDVSSSKSINEYVNLFYKIIDEKEV